MLYPEAKIALCKCKEGQRAFGVRFEEYENEWKATWAFVIKKDGTAQREKYDKTKLKGLIRLDSKYPGCSYCGSRGFVICGDCGGLNCNIHESDETFTCGWCGETGSLVDYEGDGFNAGVER